MILNYFLRKYFVYIYLFKNVFVILKLFLKKYVINIWIFFKHILIMFSTYLIIFWDLLYAAQVITWLNLLNFLLRPPLPTFYEFLGVTSAYT